MVVEPLNLPRNEHLDNMLEMLSRKKYNPKLLSLIQNMALFYQALVTKRVSGSMSSKQRDEHARNNYRTFTVPSFLCWWKLKCASDPPSWLTLELMGRSTGSDTGE